MPMLAFYFNQIAGFLCKKFQAYTDGSECPIANDLKMLTDTQPVTVNTEGSSGSHLRTEET